jgi:hypothetical protein
VIQVLYNISSVERPSRRMDWFCRPLNGRLDRRPILCPIA